MLKWLLGRLCYPGLTCGAVLLTLWACRNAVPLPFIAVGLTVCTMSLVLLIEWGIPYSSRWASFGADERIDPLHFLFSERAYDLGALLSMILLAPLGDFVHRLGVSIWPRSSPLWMQVGLAILLSDLALYFGHRLSHTVPFLWRLHALHHTAPRLHFLSVWRAHPLDNVIRAAMNTAPLALCGVPAEVIALMAAFSGTSVLLSHCNADLRTGPLDLVFNTPNVHRWHHSRDVQESTANYAPVLALWDHLFGTRHIPPERNPPEDVGLPVGLCECPGSFWAQLRAPFTSWPS